MRELVGARVEFSVAKYILHETNGDRIRSSFYLFFNQLVDRFSNWEFHRSAVPLRYHASPFCFGKHGQRLGAWVRILDYPVWDVLYVAEHSQTRAGLARGGTVG